MISTSIETSINTLRTDITQGNIQYLTMDQCEQLPYISFHSIMVNGAKTIYTMIYKNHSCHVIRLEYQGNAYEITHNINTDLVNENAAIEHMITYAGYEMMNQTYKLQTFGKINLDADDYYTCSLEQKYFDKKG